MSTEGGGWAIPPHSWRRRQHYFTAGASTAGGRSLCENWWLAPNPGRMLLQVEPADWDDDYCRSCERRRAQLEVEKEGG